MFPRSGYGSLTRHFASDACLSCSLPYSPFLQSFTMSNDIKSAVVDVQWDPLSPMYLLAAYSNGNTVGCALSVCCRQCLIKHSSLLLFRRHDHADGRRITCGAGPFREAAARCSEMCGTVTASTVTTVGLSGSAGACVCRPVLSRVGRLRAWLLCHSERPHGRHETVERVTKVRHFFALSHPKPAILVVMFPHFDAQTPAGVDPCGQSRVCECRAAGRHRASAVHVPRWLCGRV